MTHIYKARRYAILKVGSIPIELQEDAIFHSKMDVLSLDADIKLNYFEEFIDGEWIGLDVLNERKN